MCTHALALAHHVRTHVRTFAHLRTCTSTRTQTHVHTLARPSPPYASAHICMCRPICTHAFSINIQTHTHTHTYAQQPSATARAFPCSISAQPRQIFLKSALWASGRGLRSRCQKSPLLYQKRSTFNRKSSIFYTKSQISTFYPKLTRVLHPHKKLLGIQRVSNLSTENQRISTFE